MPSAEESDLLGVGRRKRVLKHIQRPLHIFGFLRRWLNARWQLRRCTKIGLRPRVSGKIFVFNHGRIIIGNQVVFNSFFSPSLLATFTGGSIEIGDRSYLNYGLDISATKLVKIGENCLIGTNVIILDNAFHDLVDRALRPEPQPVIICDNVWIANRAIILPGVTIGEGAVVGAGSVVTRDVTPRTVVAGNPARVIKSL